MDEAEQRQKMKELICEVYKKENYIIATTYRQRHGLEPGDANIPEEIVYKPTKTKLKNRVFEEVVSRYLGEKTFEEVVSELKKNGLMFDEKMEKEFNVLIMPNEKEALKETVK